MSGSRRRTTVRVALAFALTYLMVWGSMPAPALAQMAEEAALAAQSTEQVDDVPAPSSEAPRVAIPSIAEGLTYDGTEQVGVAAGDGYVLAGDASATRAGEYVATATPADGYVWGDGTSGPVELRWSIARRSATVRADDKTKSKGEADPELTATVEGLMGDDKVAYELSRDAGEEPGEYAITPTGDTEQSDYEVEFAAGRMTVTEPVALSAQADGDPIASGAWGTCPWEISADGTLTIRPGKGADQSYYYSESPWINYSASITSVVFAVESDAKVELPASCQNLFRGLDKVASMDLLGANTSGVTDISSMFYGCSRLDSLNLSGWAVSSAADFSSMFCGCSKLKALNLSGWDVSGATYMDSMFGNCPSLASLDLSEWKLGSVAPRFTDLARLSSLDLTGWDTSGLTSMSSMFSGCSSLTSLDLSSWKTAKVTDMSSMFSGCSSLTSVGDLSEWDTSRVTDMSSMFSGCSSLISIEGLSEWDTGLVTSMSSMFSGCSSLTSAGDLSEWDTTLVTGMSSMFFGCSSLTSVEGLSEWDTALVTNMSSMFSGCSSLTSVEFLSGWSVSKVTGMSSMFSGCSSLTSIDLSQWDTSSAVDEWGMFSNCSSLSEVRVRDNHKLGLSSLPSNELNGTKYWYSKALGRFLSYSELQSRQGVADVYLRRFKSGEIPMSSTHVELSRYLSYTYDGTQKKPEPTVTQGAQTLRSGIDYEVRYSNNIDAGTATVTVVGKGYYSGSNSVTFHIEPAEIYDVDLSREPQVYDGYAQTPSIRAVTAHNSLTVPASGYTVSYTNNVKVGYGTVTVTGKGNYKGSASTDFYIETAPDIRYNTHVQRKGWQHYVENGDMSGTSGKSLRLEGIQIHLNGNRPFSGGIQYRTHVQRIGWQGWRKNGDMAGTYRQSKRLEAIEIKLYGEMAKHYDVYYRVHCQKFGWMGWAKNGQRSGSAGYGRRLEGIQIVLVKKGRPGPKRTLKGITQRFSAPFKQKGKK